MEDVFQGFKVLYNMERKVCGFYIIWKANFVGRITVEVVFYLNYPTLWKSITFEVVLYLNYPTLWKMFSKGLRFNIIWRANFVVRITVEDVLYLNYPTLWKSITVEVVLSLNYPYSS